MLQPYLTWVNANISIRSEGERNVKKRGREGERKKGSRLMLLVPVAQWESINHVCWGCMRFDSRLGRWTIFSFLPKLHLQISLSLSQYLWPHPILFSQLKHNHNSLTFRKGCQRLWTADTACTVFYKGKEIGRTGEPTLPPSFCHSRSIEKWKVWIILPKLIQGRSMKLEL